jgi:predicted ATPase
VGKPRRGSRCSGPELAAYRATEAATYVPFYLTLLADAEGKANELDQGLGHLAEAEGLVAESEERWTEAELHRVREELLRTGGDRSAAERCFRRAIGIAQQQSAKFWELRAATSLARLWREQGKRDDAGVFSHPSTVGSLKNSIRPF